MLRFWTGASFHVGFLLTPSFLPCRDNSLGEPNQVLDKLVEYSPLLVKALTVLPVEINIESQVI